MLSECCVNFLFWRVICAICCCHHFPLFPHKQKKVKNMRTVCTTSTHVINFLFSFLAMRKIRFFLHPDKLPLDFTAEQSFLCKILWDVTCDAWEKNQK